MPSSGAVSGFRYFIIFSSPLLRGYSPYYDLLKPSFSLLTGASPRWSEQLHKNFMGKDFSPRKIWMTVYTAPHHFQMIWQRGRLRLSALSDFAKKEDRENIMSNRIALIMAILAAVGTFGGTVAVI